MTPDAIPVDTITIVDSPDVRAWPITTTITRLDFEATDVRVTFDKRDGPDRWPDVTPPGWDGPIQFTLWAIIRVRGEWVATGCIEFWQSRLGVGGPFSHGAQDWWMRSPAMAGQQPQPGDEVGFMVVAGDQRLKDVRSVEERSNIVLITVPAQDTGVFTFAAPGPDPAPPPGPDPIPASPTVTTLLTRIAIAVEELVQIVRAQR